MNILPHKLKPSKEAITSQSGLLALLQLMQSLGFAHCIDQYFPAPKRKSGFPASTYLKSIILLLHSGGTRLDDMRTLRNDAALVSLLDIPCFPSGRAVGAWLHRMSKEQGVAKAQQAVLTSTLLQLNTLILFAINLKLHTTAFCFYMVLLLFLFDFCCSSRFIHFCLNSAQHFYAVSSYVPASRPQRYKSLVVRV